MQVPGFIRRGDERCDPHPPRRATTGVLKIFNLRGQLRLAGTRSGGRERVNMIQNMHECLQPFAFVALCFFHFEPERGFLTIVHLLHELGKLPDFLGHTRGDFFRAVGSFFRLELIIKRFNAG